MRILLAHKIKLDCNARQRNYFAQACGCARKAYNWGLDAWKEQYALYKAAKKANPNQTEVDLPNQYAIRRRLNTIKREQFDYMLYVTKCAPQHAIMQLGAAFKNFFRDPKRFHYPKYRRKYVDDHFTISNDQFEVKGSQIRIPLLGWVRMCESLRFKGKILSATISRQARCWFVSLQVELPDLSHLKAADNQGVCGVDLGIHDLAVLSDGTRFEGPKALRKYMKRLKHLQKNFSRTMPKSHRREKARMRVATLHAKIANIRNDALHKLTTYLTRHYETIVIEDLNVKGMMKNHHLAGSIADMGFFEFRRQLEYKANLRGGQVIVADRFFPSSKTCRFCHQTYDGLTLGQRKWVCPHCGANIDDRDLNAAMNLKNLAASYAVTALGGEGSGLSGNAQVKPTSVNWEGNRSNLGG